MGVLRELQKGESPFCNHRLCHNMTERVTEGENSYKYHNMHGLFNIAITGETVLHIMVLAESYRRES